MNETIEMSEDEELKDNLKLCYSMISGKKMKLREQIGFEYRGRHYILIRDE